MIRLKLVAEVSKWFGAEVSSVGTSSWCLVAEVSGSLRYGVRACLRANFII